MGVYDTFIDGDKSVQLKNFDSCLLEYKVGDKVPVRKFRYPKNCGFFCFAQPKQFVVIKNGVFVKITEDINEVPKRIWNCSGTEYEKKE